jgi:hypothetical protein
LFGVAQILHCALNWSGLREHFTPKYVSMLRRHLLAAAAELTRSPGGDPAAYGTRARTGGFAA